MLPWNASFVCIAQCLFVCECARACVCSGVPIVGTGIARITADAEQGTRIIHQQYHKSVFLCVPVCVIFVLFCV
uniref:Putative secreted protein n=1 Tax=Anopheles triannulatus TaxID=58253 RepID=A0A2M4B319_9DIPT